MNNKELLEYIQNNSNGRYKTINDIRNDHSEYAKEFRKVLSKIMKNDRKKDLKKSNKLKFSERYSKINAFEDKSKNYLHDNITGSLYSQDRLSKKAIKRTLEKPSGRQLRKEKRFLREQLKLNAESTEM